MSIEDMKALREAANLTQAQMGERMGMGKTAYVELETDPEWKKFKPKHQLALERASLTLALERGRIELALPSVRRDALRLAQMITGEGPVLYEVVGGFMGGRREVLVRGSAAEALTAARQLQDQSASNIVITAAGRAYSLDQLRGLIDEGALV